MLTLPAATTALILIDLQKGILAMPTEPHPSAAVLAKGQALAQRFRAAKAPVVLVNVAFSPDFGDAPKAPVDRPPQMPAGGFPKGWADLADGLAAPSDIRITKRQWGAFYGTELDLQLRRRGITTVVIGGIATNIGVESTARAAHEHGYGVVLAEDACASRSAAMHAFAFEHIFPSLGRVVTAGDIVLQA
ncbi:hydrolase [Bradyrhizobium sp. U87765 SZCCT0131]|uniref:hydrolase n=1 Tax=unclassified Bradyrhizobium TaxID=2631580 RepID=UPI001BA667C7|nr:MULTISPECIES: hydrolase [unclassified Bradyrhizobium]MBR1223020.1 hydrolase [Bradyrhizobium sp. U87765 SZCCT0131]MBR1262756.1 hydrolase [Bradyrhizobium sp. U87765 SZCCT0134]MBR1308772.1 hydrolase [Bradyrhizobium sp. U87765 SZCCT0110]MBR1318538.1 hydrolase [Bradyrhizobium sp. U87765 SZCCT0109]MBR1352242.1 hydrolase [Bradyrhizobium sp. U87765 SZCCT0048]